VSGDTSNENCTCVAADKYFIHFRFQLSDGAARFPDTATTPTRSGAVDSGAHCVVQDAEASSAIGAGLQRFPAQSTIESVSDVRRCETSRKLLTDPLDNIIRNNWKRLTQTDEASAMAAIEQSLSCDEVTGQTRDLCNYPGRRIKARCRYTQTHIKWSLVFF
jgi:hypothetical protein